MKMLHYVLIAQHLTGDSEVLFFPTAELAKAKFTEETEPLLAICRKNELELDNVYSPFTLGNVDGAEIIGWRFNGGEDEDLDELLGEVNMYITYASVEVADDVTHYVVDFSEYVDESALTFHSETSATEYYQKLITENIDALNDTQGVEVDVFDEKTWTDDRDRTVFDGSTENECYFGFNEVSCTVRLGTIPDYTSETYLKVQAFKDKFSLDKTKVYIGTDPTPDTLHYLMTGQSEIICVSHNRDTVVKAVQAKIDANEELTREGREPDEFIEDHILE